MNLSDILKQYDEILELDNKRTFTLKFYKATYGWAVLSQSTIKTEDGHEARVIEIPNINEFRKNLAKIIRQNKKLIEALQFYAISRHPVYQDKAKTVLAEILREDV